MDNTKNNPNNKDFFRGESDKNHSFFAGENGKISKDRAVISIERYRKLTGDEVSNNEMVLRKVSFIERLCREVIKEEFKKYAKKKSVTKDSANSA